MDISVFFSCRYGVLCKASLYKVINKAPRGSAHTDGGFIHTYAPFVFSLQIWRHFPKTLNKGACKTLRYVLHTGGLHKVLGYFTKPLFRGGFIKPLYRGFAHVELALYTYTYMTCTF